MARILIVEDYPPLAKVVAIAIQREGHDVERAGSIARALATPGQYQLAVIDLDLPDGVGTALADELWKQGRLGSAIFFTSTKDHALENAARRRGIVVHKESGVDELMVWVRREFARPERMARAVGAEPSTVPPLPGRSGTHKRFV